VAPDLVAVVEFPVAQVDRAGEARLAVVDLQLSRAEIFGKLVVALAAVAATPDPAESPTALRLRVPQESVAIPFRPCLRRLRLSEPAPWEIPNG
jgi:hypothetical protein